MASDFDSTFFGIGGATDVPRSVRRGIAEDFLVREGERPLGNYYDPSTDISSRNLEAFMAAGGNAPIVVPSWLKSGGGDVRGRTPAENITLKPGTQYRLVDNTGKNEESILASGSTPEELFRLQQIVQNQLVPQGGQANWRIEEVGPQGEARVVAGDLYNKPITGMIADVALPLALSFTPLGPVGGAALGSLGSSAIQGRSLDDALLRAGISAATSFGLDKLGFNDVVGKLVAPKAATVAGQVAGKAASQGVSQGVAKAAEQGLIEVVGKRLAENALSKGISGLASNAISTGISNLATDPFQQAVDQARLDNKFGPAPEADLITVSNTATKPGSISSGIGGIASEAVSPPTTPVASDEIVVTGEKNKPAGPSASELIGATLPVAAVTIPQIAAPSAVSPSSGTSTAERALLNAPRILGGIGALLGSGGGGDTGGIGLGGGFDQTVNYQPLNRTRNAATFDPFTYGQKAGEFRFFNDGVPQYQVGIGSGNAMIAPLPPQPVGLKEGGSVKGIGNSDDAAYKAWLNKYRVHESKDYDTRSAFKSGLTPDERGHLNDEWKLPNHITYSDEARSARAPNAPPAGKWVGDDKGGWSFYASPTNIKNAGSPEALQQYFQKYEPGVKLVMPETQPRASGGHVRGIGGGQDDLIDARLSDGEYVISAQDVSDLGDGSNDEGARRLDEMRKLIRKNAGRRNTKTIAKPQKSVSSLLRAVK